MVQKGNWPGGVAATCRSSLSHCLQVSKPFYTCTMYSVWYSTVYSVQCTVYRVQCKVYSLTFTVYSVWCLVSCAESTKLLEPAGCSCFLYQAFKAWIEGKSKTQAWLGHSSERRIESEVELARLEINVLGSVHSSL